MEKLSPTQQSVIDALKNGGTLAVMFHIGYSRWVLSIPPKTYPWGVTISGNTVKALQRKGVIVRKENHKVYPSEIWAELTDAAQS